MVKCTECKYCIGQMEDYIEGEWYSFFNCAIEGPIAAETAEDDSQDCDLFVAGLCYDDAENGDQ